MSYDTITETFTGIPARTITCWCSVQFVIPKSLYEYYQRRNDAEPGSFALHCPVGHSMVPAKRGEAERLRDELAREKHRTEQARADAEAMRRRVTVRDRQIAARKGQITKLRKRVGNGVCPCCNRYFPALHQHMAKQHPDWSPETEGDTSDAVLVMFERMAQTNGIRAERHARRWSVDDLAARTGYAANSIRTAEGGHSSDAMRMKIATAFVQGSLPNAPQGPTGSDADSDPVAL